MSSHCHKKHAAFLPWKWLKTACFCIEDAILLLQDGWGGCNVSVIYINFLHILNNPAYQTRIFTFYVYPYYYGFTANELSFLLPWKCERGFVSHGLHVGCHKFISIHAPARGTSWLQYPVMACRVHFNSRPCERGDGIISQFYRALHRNNKANLTNIFVEPIQFADFFAVPCWFSCAALLWFSVWERPAQLQNHRPSRLDERRFSHGFDLMLIGISQFIKPHRIVFPVD